MVLCPNCNRSFDDDFEFCPYCGCKKPQAKVCPRCALETYEVFSFCPKCGAELMAGERYSEAIGIIQGLVTNGDYDAALLKCYELFDEKKYDGNRIRDAVLDVLKKERKLNDEINNDLKEMGEIGKRIEKNEKTIQKNNKIIEKINSKAQADLLYDEIHQRWDCSEENKALLKENKALDARADVLFVKINDFIENPEKRRELKL
ncbi:zinc ribbon domain-containing protein [Methanobrevibacter sp.]|uniref:zinc ribbon domain-containing protein n=1 Tax=Methanobrevibacter sp. TaxID=66852 RepID=UPI0038638E14